MLGDKAYNGTELREELDENGTKPVIPNRSMILGRIASHYEKIERNYLASVCLAAVLVWWI